MSPTITTYLSTAEWLADKAGCGATTAYKLTATCPSTWGGPWTVWASHHEPTWEPQEQTTAMSAGLTWEQYVLSWYDDTIVEPAGLVLDTQIMRVESITPGLPLRPSPDGLVWDDGVVFGGVDVKCPRYGWDDYAKDGTVVEAWATTLDLDAPMAKGWLGRRREEYPCPLHYVVQVYTTMLALRRAGHPVEWYDLVVCFGPHDTRRIRFFYDEGVCQELLRLLTEAWQDIVVEANEPAPDETRQAWDYLLRKPRAKPVLELDPSLPAHAPLCADVVEYVAGHGGDRRWQASKKALRPHILDEATRRGVEGFIFTNPAGTYRVKVGKTGRFTVKHTPTKEG